jgi:hypothetical protein
MGDKNTLGGIAGTAFALIMAVEYALNPPRRQQAALEARSAYADILAKHRSMEDGALEDAYQAAVSLDEITVPDVLRKLAYNDVTDEQGCDPLERFELSRFDRAISHLA